MTTTIIAFVSQKGGVGKSTLSRAIAREAAAGGVTVKIADLSVQWCAPLKRYPEGLGGEVVVVGSARPP